MPEEIGNLASLEELFIYSNNLIGVIPTSIKMPFHWKCFYRGPILAGTCHSAKMNKTIIVRRTYLHYIKKYQRYNVRIYFLSSGSLVHWSFWRINKFHPLCSSEIFFFLVAYLRYEKRHSNIPAHVSPCFHVKEGDHVTIGQCRPLSKTKRFNVLKVTPAGSSGTGRKAFAGI
ncbi:hypothetical protein DVH24_017679 [Malus domestica]|uniref:40S ribosomal protein S11 N-terminal domain-containing protein n=1 Tax=Malus domestica TaxID=3750 RepID=A0A498KE56_MALDO|nr:hypothetical protein DVH24_017679 [Malus domestica]